MSRREADDSFSGGEYGAIKSMSLQACCREGKWPKGILHLEYGVWGGEPSRGNGVLSQVSHKQEETGWIVLIGINSYSGGCNMDGLYSFHPSIYPPSPIPPSIHSSISLCTSSIYLPNLPSIPFVHLMVHHASYSLSFYYPPATLTSFF